LKLAKKIKKSAIPKKQSLEAFLAQNSREGGFLQSDHWAKFQRFWGREVIEIYDGGFFRQSMEFHSLPGVRGYFFIPRGPVLAQNLSFQDKPGLVDEKQIRRRFLGCITAAQKDQVAWIRLEPQDNLTLNFIKKLAKENKWQLTKSKKNHQPPQTLLLEVGKGQEQLLVEMKSKTRYNIRLAEKKGVEIREILREDSRGEKYFWELSQKTAQRNAINLHPREYYQKMLEVIPEDKLKLYLAYYQDKVIAAGLFSFYGSVATYLHGASDHGYRNLMAPYLLQWRVILDAKAKKFRAYDFGGVKINSQGEPQAGDWEGLTRFKIGFCPQNKVTQFPGCYDLILNKRTYWVYRRLQSLKDFSRKISFKRR